MTWALSHQHLPAVWPWMAAETRIRGGWRGEKSMVTGWLMFTSYAHKQLTVTVDSACGGVFGLGCGHSHPLWCSAGASLFLQSPMFFFFFPLHWFKLFSWFLLHFQSKQTHINYFSGIFLLVVYIIPVLLLFHVHIHKMILMIHNISLVFYLFLLPFKCFLFSLI